MKKTFFVGLLAALVLSWGTSAKADSGHVVVGDRDSSVAYVEHGGCKGVCGDASSILSTHQTKDFAADITHGDIDHLLHLHFDHHKNFGDRKKGDKDKPKNDIVPVPESGTLTMLAAGLLGLAGIARRSFLNS